MWRARNGSGATRKERTSSASHFKLQKRKLTRSQIRFSCFKILEKLNVFCTRTHAHAHAHTPTRFMQLSKLSLSSSHENVDARCGSLHDVSGLPSLLFLRELFLTSQMWPCECKNVGQINQNNDHWKKLFWEEKFFSFRSRKLKFCPGPGQTKSQTKSDRVCFGFLQLTERNPRSYWNVSLHTVEVGKLCWNSCREGECLMWCLPVRLLPVSTRAFYIFAVHLNQ